VEVSYCDRWHRYLKEIIHQIEVDEARALHDSGKPYTVILGESRSPFCFIEINLGCYGVSFLDEQKREYLMYTFEDTHDGRLFLKEAIWREFIGRSDEVKKGTAYHFSQEGTVSIEDVEHPFHQSTVREHSLDVSANWESRPEFGEYEALARKDRQLSRDSTYSDREL